MDLCSSCSVQLHGNCNEDHFEFQYLENDLLCYSVDGYALLSLFTVDSSDMCILPIVLDDEDDNMTSVFSFAFDHTVVLPAIFECTTLNCTDYHDC